MPTVFRRARSVLGVLTAPSARSRSIRTARSVLPVLAAACVLAALGTPLAHADALDDIAHRGVLRVAVPEDYPPFGSVGTDMQPQGYDIDTAALIAKALKVRLELTPVNSANRIPYLTTHKVDLAISTLGKTPEREKVLDFSIPYAPYYQGVFGPPEIKVSSPADLAGKTIGTTRGALEEVALTQTAPPSAQIKRFDDNNATIAAFLSGQVQLVAVGNIVAAAILAKNPPKKPEPKFVIRNSPCLVGVNKGEPRLLDKVNAALTEAKRDGTLNAMSVKWFHAPLPAGF
jgi:polar amino acid transport system substrate-binding protein